MARTEQEIRELYSSRHDAITKCYYSDPKYFIGGLPAFQVVHEKNWRDMEADLIAEGYQKPPEPPGPSIDDRLRALELAVEGLKKLEPTAYPIE